MNMNKEPNKDLDAHDGAALNRRAVLMTAAVAASAVAGISPALADTPPLAGFGAPLVELHVPAGVLTLEQKAAMIKGMTDVVSNAMKLAPGPTTRYFAQVIETAEGRFGVDGKVFVLRAK